LSESVIQTAKCQMRTCFYMRNDLGHGLSLVDKTKCAPSRQDPMGDDTRCTGIAPNCAKGCLISLNVDLRVLQLQR